MRIRDSYDVGVDHGGRIEGIDIVMEMRSGNVADLSPGVLGRALCHGDNCYYLPNVRLSGFPCKTNTVSNTAFRGFGAPQGMLAIEVVIEHIARELGKSVDDIRAINYYGTSERNVTPYEQVIKDNIIVELTDRLAREIDYEARKEGVEQFNAGHQTLKRGIALMPVKFGISFNAPVLNQAMASYLLDHHIDEQLQSVHDAYRKKALRVRKALEEGLGDALEECRGGSGGFYYYLTFKKVQTHTQSAFFQYTNRSTGDPLIDGPKHAKYPKVAYVPGEYCVHNHGHLVQRGRRQFRLSYAFENTHRIEQAINILNDACQYAS